MNRELIRKVAADYCLNAEEIFDDISASGLHLWHDENVGLSFSLEQYYTDEYPVLSYGVYEEHKEYSSRISLKDVSPALLKKIITSLKNGRFSVKKENLDLGKKLNIKVFDLDTDIELFNETV